MKRLGYILTVILSVCIFAGASLSARCEQTSFRQDSKISEPRLGNAETRRQLLSIGVDSLFILGYKHTIEPIQADSAILYYSAAISREKDLRGDSASMSNIVKSLINTAYLYTNTLNNISESYRLLRHAEEICKQYGMKSILAHIYLNLSEIYATSEHVIGDNSSPSEKPESWEYLREAFRMANENGNGEVLAFSLYNMSNSWLGVNDEELAHFSGLYLKNETDTTAPYYKFTDSLCRGIIALHNGDYEEAQTYFRDMEAQENVVSVIDKRMNHYSKYLTGITLEKMGQPKEALARFKEIYDESVDMSDMKSILWICYAMSSFFERQGDSFNSDKYQLHYYKTREAMSAAGFGENIHEVDLSRMIEDFNHEIAEAKIRDRKNTLIIIAICVGCGILIIILSLFLWYSHKRRQYIMKLYEKNQEIAISEKSVADQTLPKAESELKSDPNQHQLSDKETELIKDISAILSDNTVICNPGFQMSSLCESVGSNPSYVSRAINNHYGKNFKTLLTELRIKEACRRLDNPSQSDKFTIESISCEVGFKSRAAFSVAFKNVTGLTPSEYRNAAKRYSPHHEN